ncbi:solute carrier organic anion transporter family member 1B2-like isoform X2 [Dipodomys merriami]|uniref:solute carrier organic anion transporter family member 1B2-like isoform X2 n=1 Tax=Dipodomys merriami TaxID=94247 RepID=UPI003855FE38
MDQNKNKTMKTNSPEKRKAIRIDQFKIFLAALTFSYVCKTLGGVLMKATLTQIEKRFEISSSKSGFIDGGFEWGNLLVIVFVSYFGSKLHRPKLIGIGSLVMGAGSIVIALPHFLMGRYRYSADSANSSVRGLLPTCSPNQTGPGPEPAGAGCDQGSESYYWLYVFLGNMLRGVGETPIVPLGISYIEDFSEEGNSSIYLGILHAIAMVGPILGFLMASVFSQIYVDVGFVDLSSVRLGPQDARWVGAWWLCFLVSGLLSALSALPYFFLPKDPRAARSGSASTQGLKAAQEPALPARRPSQTPPALRGFLLSMKRLLCNRLYMLFLVTTVLKVSALIGAFTYLFKYMEQQYGQRTSHANFLLGGYIIRRFKLSVLGIGKLLFGTTLVSVLLHVVYYVLLCDSPAVAGLTVPYHGVLSEPPAAPGLPQCRAHCGCSEQLWEPVCGADGVTYLTPCLAGCPAPAANGSGSTGSTMSTVSTVSTVSPRSTVSTESTMSPRSSVSTESTMSPRSTVSTESTMSPRSTESTESTGGNWSTGSINSTVSPRSTASNRSTMSTGSTGSTESINSTVFHNCSCVRASASPARHRSAQLGECPRSDACKKRFHTYLAVQALQSFFTALGTPALMLLLMRLVEPDLKSLAMGFHALSIRTLGGILAPIYFGSLIDRTCVKWSITPCGKRGVCRMYNSTLFGITYLGLQSILKILGVVFYIVLIWAMKKKYKDKASKDTGNGEKATDEANGESANNNGHLVSETCI